MHLAGNTSPFKLLSAVPRVVPNDLLDVGLAGQSLWRQQGRVVPQVVHDVPQGPLLAQQGVRDIKVAVAQSPNPCAHRCRLQLQSDAMDHARKLIALLVDGVNFCAQGEKDKILNVLRPVSHEGSYQGETKRYYNTIQYHFIISFEKFSIPTTSENSDSLFKSHSTVKAWRNLDRYSMFYAQSITNSGIRVKQKVFLPQVKILIHYSIHIPL